MRFIKNSDGLLAFLILSLITLVIVNDEGIDFLFDKSERLDMRIDVEKQLSYPLPGYLNGNEQLHLYNDENELWYSLDGGDRFIKSDANLDLTDVINYPIIYNPTSLRWHHPKGDFPKLISLPIVIKNKTGELRSQEKVLTFFEQFNSKVPVVSLSIKNSDLFDEENGLMVYGKSSWNDSSFYKEWWYRSANFSERGKEWERAVNFQYFVEGRLQFEQDCGLRVSGNATRYFPQKSFRIYARKLYESDQLDFPFWGDKGIKSAKSLLLRNGGNDNTKTMFADLFMQQLARGSNLLTQAGHPVSVFINGNYWGLYDIRERIDAFYVAEHEDVKEDEVTILDAPHGALKEGSESVQREFLDLVDKLSVSPLITDKLYDEAEHLIDINSFIDYIFYETFYCNNDWPHNNAMWYKAGEGKWKWILNDLDYGLAYLGEKNVNTNLFDKLKNSNTVIGILFTKLYTNGSFEKRFRGRCYDLVTYHLCDKNIQNCFEELKSSYQTEIKKHISRWRMIDSVVEWENNCKKNLDFLMQRKEIYLKQISDL